MGDAMAKAIDGIKGLSRSLAAAEPKAKLLTDVVKTIKTDVKKKDVNGDRKDHRREHRQDDQPGRITATQSKRRIRNTGGKKAAQRRFYC